MEIRNNIGEEFSLAIKENPIFIDRVFIESNLKGKVNYPIKNSQELIDML